MIDYINNNFVAEVPRDVYAPHETLHSKIGSLDDSKAIPITTTYLVLNTLMGKNTLIEGGSGTGKTLLSSVVASLMSQIPYEFFERRKITGVPGVQVNDIYATTDLSEMQKGRDVAFLYQNTFSPVLLMDELNRFDELSQNRIREGLSSHVWQYANHSWKIPGQLAIATINPETYGGTCILNENLLDNFSLILEPAYFNILEHSSLIVTARDNAREKLGLEAVIDELDAFYEKNKNDFEKVRRYIQNIQNTTAKEFVKRKIPFIHNGEISEVKKEIEEMEFDPEARLLLYCAMSESTWSRKFGRIRHEDPKSDSTHDAAYLSSMIQEGFAGRIFADIKSSAKAIAWYLGNKYVKIEDLKTAFIYSSPRRVKPTDEFYQEVLSSTRALPIRHEIARRTFEKVWENYSDFKDGNNKSFQLCREAIINLQKGENTSEARENIASARATLERTDHPLAQSILEYLAYREIKTRKEARQRP